MSFVILLVVQRKLPELQALPGLVGLLGMQQQPAKLELPWQHLQLAGLAQLLLHNRLHIHLHALHRNHHHIHHHIQKQILVFPIEIFMLV